MFFTTVNKWYRQIYPVYIFEFNISQSIIDATTLREFPGPID